MRGTATHAWPAGAPGALVPPLAPGQALPARPGQASAHQNLLVPHHPRHCHLYPVSPLINLLGLQPQTPPGPAPRHGVPPNLPSQAPGRCQLSHWASGPGPGSQMSGSLTRPCPWSPGSWAGTGCPFLPFPSRHGAGRSTQLGVTPFHPPPPHIHALKLSASQPCPQAQHWLGTLRLGGAVSPEPAHPRAVFLGA